MRSFEAGQTVVRCDVHRTGRVWSEHALRVVADTSEALVAACSPGAETRWPTLYVKARTEGDPSVRTEAFDAMATGVWELADAVWQETELLLWKGPTAWFSVNAFYTSGGLRNWYVNFEHPTRRTTDGFDTFDLTVDLVVDPDLTRWEWKDEDEYAHVRRLGIERWAAWRWELAWPTPRLPQPAAGEQRVAPKGGRTVGWSVAPRSSRGKEDASQPGLAARTAVS